MSKSEHQFWEKTPTHTLSLSFFWIDIRSAWEQTKNRQSGWNEDHLYLSQHSTNNETKCPTCGFSIIFKIVCDKCWSLLSFLSYYAETIAVVRHSVSFWSHWSTICDQRAYGSLAATRTEGRSLFAISMISLQANPRVTLSHVFARECR